jgi:hypothetical protein
MRDLPRKIEEIVVKVTTTDSYTGRKIESETSNSLKVIRTPPAKMTSPTHLNKENRADRFIILRWENVLKSFKAYYAVEMSVDNRWREVSASRKNSYL